MNAISDPLDTATKCFRPLDENILIKASHNFCKRVHGRNSLFSARISETILKLLPRRVLLSDRFSWLDLESNDEVSLSDDQSALPSLIVTSG